MNCFKRGVVEVWVSMSLEIMMVLVVVGLARDFYQRLLELKEFYCGFFFKNNMLYLFLQHLV